MGDSNSNTNTLGYTVTLCAPGALSPEGLGQCIAIIKAGSAVDAESAEQELPRATVLTVARKGTSIVGVGAIKRERKPYASTIAKRSANSFPPDTLELGYVAVDLEHRGHHLSDRIVSTLISGYEGPLWATTSNVYMKKCLERAGFIRKGNEWQGSSGLLSFWFKSGHVEEERRQDNDLLKHMHDVAGKYHLHYSTVRTTATSLILPIGILASVTIMTNCSDGIRVPIRFLVFVIIGTLFLNMIFARWSRACRHLERYYEELMEKTPVFDAQRQGFRHLFRQKIRKPRPPKPSDVPISPLERLNPYNPKTWLDPFVWSIILLGAVYLWFYDQMFHYACGGVSLGGKIWSLMVSHI